MNDNTPLHKTVLPLLPHGPAPVLSPEVAAKAARYNFEENEPEGGIQHPQWKTLDTATHNTHWNPLVNRPISL